jgi:hypothetical protein
MGAMIIFVWISWAFANPGRFAHHYLLVRGRSALPLLQSLISCRIFMIGHTGIQIDH